MKEIILIKVGELVLKGLNRRTFEDILKKNIKNCLNDLGKFDIYSAQSTIYVEPKGDDIDLDRVCERMKKVFGIVAFSRACCCEKDFDDIKEKALVYLKDELSSAETFKVEAKRSDKKFAMNHPRSAWNWAE